MSASDFTAHLIRGHEVLRVDDTRFVYRDDAGKRHPERFLSFAALPIDGVNRLVLLTDPEPYGTDVAGVVNMDATAEELAGGQR